ncbi:MAG: universal stress protein [Burkholderiaceae bacterium]
MKFLVATDGSKYALAAVAYAAKLALLIGPEPTTITLLSVHDDAGLRRAKAFAGSESVAKFLRESSELDLDPARKMLDAAGVLHDMEIRTGHVVQEILAVANDGKFDMVFMGSKGRGPIADLLVGSVAQRVLAMAKQPVVLVK